MPDNPVPRVGDAIQFPRDPEHPGPSPASPNVRTLMEATNLIKQANLLLDKVQSGWTVPDAPERPPVVQALNQLQALATHTTNVTQRLLSSTGG